MAAGTLLAVLSNVPWGQVIDAAPKVADGAAKLWDSVMRRKKKDLVESDPVVAADPASKVQAQLASLNASVDQLKEEMQAATELIKTLAEQNTALVQRAEMNRRRLSRHSIVFAGVAVTLTSAICVLLMRG